MEQEGWGDTLQSEAVFYKIESNRGSSDTELNENDSPEEKTEYYEDGEFGDKDSSNEQFIGLFQIDGEYYIWILRKEETPSSSLTRVI